MADKPSTKRVTDIMHRDVVSVNPKDTVHDALQLMIENRVAALPVVTGGGTCVGMISTTDLIELAYAADEELENSAAGGAPTEWLLASVRSQLGRDHVETVMSSPVATVGRDTTVRAAASLMLRDRVHRLPVVNDENILVGIVSTMDMLAIVAGGEGAKG